MSKKILTLFAHPSQHRSEVNLPLVEASLSDSELTVIDLYGEYPCYDINVEIKQGFFEHVETDSITTLNEILGAVK